MSRKANLERRGWLALARPTDQQSSQPASASASASEPGLLPGLLGNLMRCQVSQPPKPKSTQPGPVLNGTHVFGCFLRSPGASFFARKSLGRPKFLDPIRPPAWPLGAPGRSPSRGSGSGHGAAPAAQKSAKGLPVLLLGKGEKGGLQKKNSSNPSSVLFLLFFLSFFFFCGGRAGGGRWGGERAFWLGQQLVFGLFTIFRFFCCFFF